jgi:hypothetical protein
LTITKVRVRIWITTPAYSTFSTFKPNFFRPNIKKTMAVITENVINLYSTELFLDMNHFPICKSVIISMIPTVGQYIVSASSRIMNDIRYSKPVYSVLQSSLIASPFASHHPGLVIKRKSSRVQVSKSAVLSSRSNEALCLTGHDITLSRFRIHSLRIEPIMWTRISSGSSISSRFSLFGFNFLGKRLGNL